MVEAQPVIQTLARLVQGQEVQPGDWSGFADFCENHQLAGYAYFRLRQSGQSVPGPIQERWNTLLFRQGLDNQRRLAFLNQLAEELPQPWMLLKGPYLAQRFYGGVQCRHLGDLDILVPPELLAPAAAVLKRHGLTCKTRFWLPQKWSMPFLHALEWSSPQHQLDLHRCLRALPWIRFNMARLWQRRQTFRLASQVYSVPGDADCLLIHLLGLHDDVGRGDWKWKAMVDLFHMLQQMDSRMDWDDFFRERSQEGLEKLSRTLLLAVLQQLQANSCFPRLAAALSSTTLPRALQDGGLSGLSLAGLRLLWARLFDLPWPIAMGWWAISLPVRWYAHH